MIGFIGQKRQKKVQHSKEKLKSFVDRKVMVSLFLRMDQDTYLSTYQSEISAYLKFIKSCTSPSIK